jgi:CO/xanthine dehydrogenase FAD-binding subunit
MLLRSGRGTRVLEAEKFFSGPMATSARPDECLEEIHWPAWSWRRTGSAFTEISVRHGDFAMVSAAAQVAVDGDGRCVRAAFGVGGAGGTPLAFPKIAARLVGTRLDDAAVEDAAQAAAAETEPGSDLHATAEYRRHLAGVLAARALREARERARSL